MSDVPPTGDQRGWTAPPPSQPPPGWNPPRADAIGPPGNGVGVAALVVGIIALVVSWIPFLGLGLALIAIVLGIVGLRKARLAGGTNRGLSVAGLVLGAIALVIGLLFTIVGVALFNNDDFRNLTDCLAAADTEEDRVTCQELFRQDLGR